MIPSETQRANSAQVLGELIDKVAALEAGECMVQSVCFEYSTKLTPNQQASSRPNHVNRLAFTLARLGGGLGSLAKNYESTFFSDHDEMSLSTTT